MASNKERVTEHYNNFDEDGRAVRTKADSLEFHYSKKLLNGYIKPNSVVIEIGCGTGYYASHFADRCSKYIGVDLSGRNIDIFNKKIAELGLKNVTAQIGDATDLSEIGDSQYDVALCLGPMYHLPRDERIKVFDECRRITRDGAILAFSYINGLGAYMGACVNWPEIYPNSKANQNVLKLHFDDDRPDLFFYTSPEEMEDDAKQAGFEIIKNRGLDFFFAQNVVNRMNDEQFKYYMEITDRLIESPSCTGLADHALLICQKKQTEKEA